MAENSPYYWLEHPDKAEPLLSDHRLKICLWEYPSFEDEVSWSVLFPYPRVALPPIIRKSLWPYPPYEVIGDGPRDSRTPERISEWRKKNPLRVYDTLLDAREYEAVMELGQCYTIPVAGVDPIRGLDGTKYGYQTFDWSLNVRLEWWSLAPDAWRPFVQWVDGLRQFLNSPFEHGG